MKDLKSFFGKDAKTCRDILHETRDLILKKDFDIKNQSAEHEHFIENI